MACKAGSLFPALRAMFFLFNGRNGYHQQPVGVTAWVEHLPSDEVPNKVPTAWDFGFHGLGLRVPRLGTPSSKAWNSEFQSLGLSVPRRGNVSSTPWEYEFHAVGMRVPRRGNASSTPWGIRVPRRGNSHLSPWGICTAVEISCSGWQSVHDKLLSLPC